MSVFIRCVQSFRNNIFNITVLFYISHHISISRNTLLPPLISALHAVPVSTPYHLTLITHRSLPEFPALTALSLHVIEYLSRFCRVGS